MRQFSRCCFAPGIPCRRGGRESGGLTTANSTAKPDFIEVSYNMNTELHNCSQCTYFVPSNVQTIGLCRKFPNARPRNIELPGHVVCPRFKPAVESCVTCTHYAPGSCRHPDPIGPAGPDGWPRTIPDAWCAGYRYNMNATME